MKPIMLRLSGLQSYREVQEVDFERLCEAGVFGIFGPTGSGKSSILDAVTLALYGKVERAAGGTQGIMNQAEKTLAVAFTFELSGGGERRRFRVERQFKRGGEVSVSNTLSRFVEVTEAGDVVIADKLADVTRCVETQIGLNMQDFTRAVVLPQGKFAEFLSLTGKDRRSMLQRLFHLERYGDGLALKLSQRMKAAEAALQEAAAEQLGLGDASAAAVDAAEARYREAAAAAAEARAALAEAERLHAERVQVRERLTALREKEALQAKLLADAPRVAELERELQRLAAAERLMPALAAAEAAEAALRAAASRREAAVLAHAARLEAASAAAAAWTAAAAEAAEGEPRLARRLDQLAGALRLESEAAELAAGIADVELRARDAAERQRSFDEAAAKAQDMLARAAAKQAELRLELKAVELTAADRDRRSKLTTRLQQYNGLSAQAAAARKELSTATERREGAKLALQGIQADHQNAYAELSEGTRQLIPLRSAIAGLADWRGQLGAVIPQWMDRVRQEQREQQRMQLALQLAADLQDGEPCPVCGSYEHGGQHAVRSGTEEWADSPLQAWEELHVGIQKLELILSPLQAKGEAAAERMLETLQGARRDISDELVGHAEPPLWEQMLLEAAASAETMAGTAELGAAELQELDAAGNVHTADAMERIQSGMTLIQELADNNGRQLALIEKAAAVARNRYAEAERRLDQALSAYATEEALTSRAQAYHDGCERELEGELAQWQLLFGDELRPDTAEAALQALDSREASADELRVRLERSVTYIEETTLTGQGSAKSAQEAQLQAVELVATLTARQEQLTEKQQQLHGITDGKSASLLLQGAEQELAELRARTVQCTHNHEAAQQSLQQAAEQRTGAAEAERAAEERHAEETGRLAEALKHSPFQTAEEAAALQPVLDQQPAMMDIVTRHREETQQLGAQVELLQEQLGGRTLTEEEWETSAAALRERRAGNELFLQSAAKAERDLESLKGKQERWNALEGKRLEMERLTGRLKSLQTVFRGNAFVEYVAEEQLVQVCRAASERLGFLTKRRYALEVDSGGGFVIRDDASGGIRRPVSTLSGGETFLASLALALALSGQIQLRGKYPLQFFFLDEGFGTLDPELLDTVITALEKLHNETLAVGVISHVPELRARLPRRLIVTPSEPFGQGSTVQLETM